MKKIFGASLIACAILMASCGGQKSGMKLTDAEWQLKVDSATLVAEAAADTTLADSTLADTTVKDSSYVEPVRELATITFTDSLLVSGTGGCNRYFGDYTTEGKNLTINLKGSTMTFCPWLDQETKYFDMLKSVSTYEIKDKELYLYDAQGTQLAVFTVKELLTPAVEEAK